MAVATGLFLAGSALNIYGQLRQAEAQEQNMLARAKATRFQADELLRRSEFNIRAMKREGAQVRGAQRAAFAKGGVDVSSKTSVAMMEETSQRVMEQILETRRVAQYQISNLLSGAVTLEEAAERVNNAKYINTFGSALSTFGNFYMMKGQPKFASGEYIFDTSGMADDANNNIIQNNIIQNNSTGRPGFLGDYYG